MSQNYLGVVACFLAITMVVSMKIDPKETRFLDYFEYADEDVYQELMTEAGDPSHVANRAGAAEDRVTSKPQLLQTSERVGRKGSRKNKTGPQVTISAQADENFRVVIYYVLPAVSLALFLTFLIIIAAVFRCCGCERNKSKSSGSCFMNGDRGEISVEKVLRNNGTVTRVNPVTRSTSLYSSPLASFWQNNSDVVPAVENLPQSGEMLKDKRVFIKSASNSLEEDQESTSSVKIFSLDMEYDNNFSNIQFFTSSPECMKTPSGLLDHEDLFAPSSGDESKLCFGERAVSPGCLDFEPDLANTTPMKMN